MNCRSSMNRFKSSGWKSRSWKPAWPHSKHNPGLRQERRPRWLFRRQRASGDPFRPVGESLGDALARGTVADPKTPHLSVRFVTSSATTPVILGGHKETPKYRVFGM